MIALNDVIDILIVAIMIYIAIRLLLETHSVSVAVGILALALVYWTSTLFNFPLTHLLLKNFFAVLVILVAIIFQGELRRLFSFVGFFSFRNSIPPAEATINAVSGAVGKLSKDHVGALVVFPGRESIGRFLEGGTSLRGDVSRALLLSIFSEETPGHDGAIIIEDNTIRRFGVHLPLAQNPEQGEKFGGLRHRAALGLSERSDAFIIVVSGETGSIDIARKGAWEHCANEAEIYQKLSEFCKESIPRQNWNYFSRWFWRNIIIFVFSLVIAFVAWIILVQR